MVGALRCLFHAVATTSNWLASGNVNSIECSKIDAKSGKTDIDKLRELAPSLAINHATWEKHWFLTVKFQESLSSLMHDHNAEIAG